MNPQDDAQTKFGLVQDMLAVPEIIRNFDLTAMRETSEQIASVGKLWLTGEGSSRLFPGKGAITSALKRGTKLQLQTEAGLQSQEYPLDDWAVFALSNSGRTAEVIGLFDQLTKNGHQHLYSLTALADSKLESLARTGYVLSCGEEHAVAATKSVLEQALFLNALLEHIDGVDTLASNLNSIADAVQTALTTSLDASLVERIANARTIYWAGRSDGVTEELTLKTNEITRKSADFLEGTYAVHGIEEVMDAEDVVIWVDPPEIAEEKFEKVLVEGVGLTVIAIADRATRFPTITIPKAPAYAEFVQMAAGWNVLVEVGLKLGVDIDKPTRARKVGNEFSG